MSVSKITNLLCFALILCIAPFTAFSRQGGPECKAKERIESLKKMKMLEVLDLDEATSDKFLIKYKALDDKIKEKEVAMNEAFDELKSALEDKDKNEIAKKSDKFLKSQNEFFQSITDKMYGLKQILTEEQFGKLLVFERDFFKELRRLMMKKAPKFKRGHFGD